LLYAGISETITRVSKGHTGNTRLGVFRYWFSGLRSSLISTPCPISNTSCLLGRPWLVRRAPPASLVGTETDHTCRPWVSAQRTSIGSQSPTTRLVSTLEMSLAVHPPRQQTHSMAGPNARTLILTISPFPTSASLHSLRQLLFGAVE